LIRSFVSTRSEIHSGVVFFLGGHKQSRACDPLRSNKIITYAMPKAIARNIIKKLQASGYRDK
jgi:fructose-bisphosphate aldolase class 1